MEGWSGLPYEIYACTTSEFWNRGRRRPDREPADPGGQASESTPEFLAITSRRHVLDFSGRPVAILEVPTAGAETYTFLSTDHLGTPFVASDLGSGEVWSGGFEPFGADWQAETLAGAQEDGVFLWRSVPKEP